MISDQIKPMIISAMKAKDERTLNVLRMLSSEFNYAKINKQEELTDEDEQAVVRREVKKRMDAVEAYTKANALDRAESEKQEAEILRQFLPAQMDDGELEKVVADTVSELGATSMKDMGKVIGSVMAKVKGKAEGSKVSELVKKALG